MAKTRLAKVVLTIKGVWSPTVEYEKLDLVNYLGSSYIAKRDNIGVTPVEGDDWSLSAEKGGKGDQGDKIYLHIAYANSEDGDTDFTTSPVVDKVYTYLGSYSDYTPEDSNVPSTYVWSKLSEEAARAAAELLRVAAEEERVAAETDRKFAESQRASAESARNTAEETRVSNEQSRASAETNRVSEESARQSAETVRVSSETDRQKAEVSRVDEEKKRVSAETDRAAAETKRIEDEQHRVSAEQSRSDAETVRVDNESARKIAEDTRVSNESARKTAETSRVNAENTRDTSETKRVNAETSRVNAETVRVNAEDARILAEQGRVTVESDRVSAEQSRVAAESERVVAENERVTTFSGYRNEIDRFKSELVTDKNVATENTRFAIGTAEQSLEVPSMEEFNQIKDEIANLDSVLYTPQTLTTEQQAQVRENIGAADVVAVNELKDDMAGKLTEPAEGLAVGKYFRVAAIDENGHAVLEAVEAKDVGVQDVQMNGVSTVTDSIANVKFQSNGGLLFDNTYGLRLQQAGLSNIDKRSNKQMPVTSNNLDYAVKAAMCDGNGAAWTADEQAAARERMGEFTDVPLATVADVTLDDTVSIFNVQLNKACRFVTCTFIIPPEASGLTRNIYFAANYTGVHSITAMFTRSPQAVTSSTNYAFFLTTALIVGGKILSFGCISGSGENSIADHQTRALNNPPNAFCVLDAENFESISVYTYGDAFPAGSRLIVTGC